MTVVFQIPSSWSQNETEVISFDQPYKNKRIVLQDRFEYSSQVFYCRPISLQQPRILHFHLSPFVGQRFNVIGLTQFAPIRGLWRMNHNRLFRRFSVCQLHSERGGEIVEKGGGGILFRLIFLQWWWGNSGQVPPERATSLSYPYITALCL